MSESSRPRPRPRPFHPKAASADLTYDMMEDELTCPVCLELFADPLMLPCSHSICKKCLQDILDNRLKLGKEDVECPSCRKSTAVANEKLMSLPKNLALENIVFRFQEIQSSNLTKSKSLDLGTNFQLNTSSDDCDVPVFPEYMNKDCGLCDSKSPAKATWFCQQCSVLYCQKCLQTYHPKRGPLSHHRVRKPSKVEVEEKPVFCCDHHSETTSIFCDTCKVLVCHLCVCEGVGKHSGHKILALDAAWKQLRESVVHSKERLESMMTNLTEQNTRLDEVTDEIELLHKLAREKIERQHRCLLQEVTQALDLQKEVVLASIGKQQSQASLQYHSQCDANKALVKSMESLAEACKKLLDEEHTKELLQKAKDVSPIVTKVDQLSKDTQSRDASFKSLVTHQPAQQDIRMSVLRFRSLAFDSLKCFTGDDSEKCVSLVPTIRSVASPGKSDAPRVQNKSLITWGFNSTTFTAEKLEDNSLWTITIEKNTNQIRDIKTGYLFGVGISSEVLNYKDQVGMSKKSYAVVCSNGNLHFCHNGKMETLMPLDALPMSVTVSAITDQSARLIFTYTLTSAVWGDTLVGKRIIENEAFKDCYHPVFTVSHRVKMQFPTHV
ncbi:E3 ubiquitin-protein ligase Midline-1-like [Haliotis asinina]|uniref:E3 ubiquitin-protein ligase Midline-1-like n=1 Tax=Haliotis asinina TaxID=109174 RepID=UPI0035320E2E